MCTVPPPGSRRVSAPTTCSVSARTRSWTRVEAAALPPSTARKALVRATMILLASKWVTLPLRRMTWTLPGAWASTSPAETAAEVGPVGATVVGWCGTVADGASLDMVPPGAAGVLLRVRRTCPQVDSCAGGDTIYAATFLCQPQYIVYNPEKTWAQAVDSLWITDTTTGLAGRLTADAHWACGQSGLWVVGLRSAGERRGPERQKPRFQTPFRRRARGLFAVLGLPFWAFQK